MLRKVKEDEDFQLSYESDGDMGTIYQKNEKSEKKPGDFFNTTQNSE